MLGELVYCADGDGQPRRQERYGLTVLRAEVRPGGWGEAGRLKRAARRLARLGVCRVLVPEEFCRWELLCRWGLGPVDPVPFFRACAGGLAAWLRREFGAPIRPDSGEIPAAVRFDGTGALEGRRVLSLFGTEPELAGIRLRAAALEPEDREKLPLMAALWEAGRGERLGLEFT